MSGNCCLRIERIMNKAEEKDLGATVTDKLSLGKHFSGISEGIYRHLRSIKAACTCPDKDIVKKLMTSLIRPRLECAASVWSPGLMKEIVKLENVQRPATTLPESETMYL